MVNPFGVKAGGNNMDLKTAIAQGFEYYRSIGTIRMECKKVEVTRLDAQHIVVHTEWNSVYLKEDEEISIPFKNNYFIRFREDEAVIFGWVVMNHNY